jgi:hypothetical protein
MCAYRCAIAHMILNSLELYAIIFQNVLASNQILAVKEATYNSLICYEDFLWTEKQPAIFSMVGKSSGQPYAQQGLRLILPWPLRPALEGAPMDVIHHSEICTKHTMTEVTNHIQVLLNLTGRSEHFCLQYNECVMDMKAKMGSICKAMIKSGISIYKFPNENQLEFGGVATMIKPQKHLSPLSINAHPQMAGMKHHYFDRIQGIKKSKASVDSRKSLN